MAAEPVPEPQLAPALPSAPASSAIRPQAHVFSPSAGQSASRALLLLKPPLAFPRSVRPPHLPHCPPPLPAQCLEWGPAKGRCFHTPGVLGSSGNQMWYLCLLGPLGALPLPPPSLLPCVPITRGGRAARAHHTGPPSSSPPRCRGSSQSRRPPLSAQWPLTLPNE